MSTPNASGATKYYTSHYNQWRCLHWMRRNKSQTENCCRVVFMTCWHKFRIIFKWRSLYCVQCWQTLAVADTVLLTYREETKQSRHPIPGLPLLEFSPALENWSDIYTGPTFFFIVLQTFAFFFFLSAISIFLSLGSANVCPVHWMLSPLHHE